MKDVIEKRYGLKGGRSKTLETIGKEYKITRERVRQIEADAFRHLTREETLQEVSHATDAIAAHVTLHGGVMAERHLFETMKDDKERPHLLFLLEVGSRCRPIPESEESHRAWAVDEKRAQGAARVMTGVREELEKKGAPVSQSALYEIVSRIGKKEFGGDIGDRVIETFLAASKVIKKNPYGEYGLSTWAAVNPRGVRDKAYVALVRAGNPLHFTEVAQAITDAGWSARKAHPQTVHNELIKDSRFVLVGRGYYALREWGYEPGVVRDVIVSALRESNIPLSKDRIVELVLKKRMVKPPTIFLNLQNRNIFKRLDDGTYTLV